MLEQCLQYQVTHCPAAFAPHLLRARECSGRLLYPVSQKHLSTQQGFRDRATAHWFSPGQLQSPVVGFQTSPCSPKDTLIGGDVQVARAWQTYEGDQELRASPLVGINDCSTYASQGESHLNYNNASFVLLLQLIIY